MKPTDFQALLTTLEQRAKKPMAEMADYHLQRDEMQIPKPDPLPAWIECTTPPPKHLTDPSSL